MSTKNHRLTHSNLGFYPVSLFVQVTDEKPDLEEEYNRIKSFGCPDIIFHGRVLENLKDMNWLIPRLASELFFVSVFQHLNPSIENIHNLFGVRRFIISIDKALLIKKYIKYLQSLQEDDTLILNFDIVETLISAQNILRKKEVKCRLMFYPSKIPSEYIINHKLFDLVPYLTTKED